MGYILCNRTKTNTTRGTEYTIDTGNVSKYNVHQRPRWKSNSWSSYLVTNLPKYTLSMYKAVYFAILGHSELDWAKCKTE